MVDKLAGCGEVRDETVLARPDPALGSVTASAATATWGNVA
jgi:hypothetical protein